MPSLIDKICLDPTIDLEVLNEEWRRMATEGLIDERELANKAKNDCPMCEKPKGNQIKWFNLSEKDKNIERISNLPTYLTVRLSTLETDHASKYDSWIRGVPNKVAFEIKTLVK